MLCTHRSCPDTNLAYLFIRVFIPIQQIYMSISHHVGTHICSTSYTKATPNKNVIHRSQIQD